MSARRWLGWLAPLALVCGGCAPTEDWDSLRNGTSGSYEELVLGSQPMAYFPLHDVPGTTQPLNLGGYGQPATVPGGVTFTGGAASFDGSGYLDLGPGYDFQGMAQYTIEAWVDAGASNTSQSLVLLSDATPGPDPIVQGYQVQLSGGMGQFQRGAGISSCVATFDYISGTGIYLVLAFAQPTKGVFNSEVYINAAPLPFGNCMTGLNDPALAQKSNLFIGADANGKNNFVGVVSEVAVYDGVLDPSVISSHFQAGKRGP